MRTSVDDELAAEARELGINVSEAAREGLRQAICRCRAERDRAAYLAHPETEDADWDEAESWQASVVNGDGLHILSQRRLTQRLATSSSGRS